MFILLVSEQLLNASWGFAFFNLQASDWLVRTSVKVRTSQTQAVEGNRLKESEVCIVWYCWLQVVTGSNTQAGKDLFCFSFLQCSVFPVCQAKRPAVRRVRNAHWRDFHRLWWLFLESYRGVSCDSTLASRWSHDAEVKTFPRYSVFKFK